MALLRSPLGPKPRTPRDAVESKAPGRGAVTRLALFGPGYTGERLATALEARGWTVTRIDRAGFADAGHAIATATHVVSTVPPDEGGDPVLARYRAALGRTPLWLGYLSSTGV